MDAILLDMVVSNLIDNALKYSPPDSTVELMLSNPISPNQLQLSISNPVKPKGLPDAGKIFSKYYRSSHFQNMDGSGLGLYLTQKTLPLLNATIRYEPSPTQVRFVLCFTL